MSNDFEVMDQRVVSFEHESGTRALICLTLTGPTGDYDVAYRVGAHEEMHNSIKLEIGAARLGLLQLPVAAHIPAGQHEVTIAIADSAALEVAVQL